MIGATAVRLRRPIISAIPTRQVWCPWCPAEPDQPCHMTRNRQHITGDNWYPERLHPGRVRYVCHYFMPADLVQEHGGLIDGVPPLVPEGLEDFSVVWVKQPPNLFSYLIKYERDWYA